MDQDQLITNTEIKVRFNECDPLQIVWHGNYLKYFEEGREDFCIKNGISYLDTKSQGYTTPIVKSVCVHKLPLKYGDDFKVETTYIPTLAVKLIFRYRVFCDEKLVCTGETVQVFLDEVGKLALIYPQFFLDWKMKMGLE